MKLQTLYRLVPENIQEAANLRAEYLTSKDDDVEADFSHQGLGPRLTLSDKHNAVTLMVKHRTTGDPLCNFPGCQNFAVRHNRCLDCFGRLAPGQCVEDVGC